MPTAMITDDWPQSISVLLKCLRKSGIWHSPNDCVHFLAVLENHHSGNASDAVLRSNPWALVCVQLELQQKLKTHCLPSVQSRCHTAAFTLTALILSPKETANSSTRGAIILQGPHHGAQKSTSTGTGLFNTSSSKVESVTGPACPGIHLVLNGARRCERCGDRCRMQLQEYCATQAFRTSCSLCVLCV